MSRCSSARIKATTCGSLRTPTSRVSPFLLTWVAPRRPLDWVMNMVKYLPMSMTQEELLSRFGPAYVTYLFNDQAYANKFMSEN